MVEAKLGLLQVPVERLPGNPVEFGQPSFCEAPERFDPVDVIGTPGKFILTMVDPKMFVESQVDQAIIPSPSVGVNETLCIGLAPDHRLENSLARIGNDFRVDPIAAFQKSEDDHFSTSARPRLPRIRCGPKQDSSASSVPLRGDSRSQASASLCRIRRKTALTVRTESPVKTDVSVAVRSMAKHRTRWRNLASEIFENVK